MSFVEFVKRKLHGKTQEWSWFAVPEGNFIDQSPPEGDFEKDKTYFEIAVHYLFLQNSREYWHYYRPLGVAYTRCIYGGSWEETPFVIGPQLLSKVTQVKKEDHIGYRNMRVAGIQPYMGDWVHLFTGLWRSPTRSIAQEVISFVETIGSAVQTPQLSACLAVAKPLVSGLETLLGINKLDLRVGYYVGYYTSPGPHKFQPGYFALIRAANCEEHKAEFWVKDDRLFYGPTATDAKPYEDADFMLYSIKRFDKREDISTFPFYEHWPEATKKVWEYKDQEAYALLDRFLAELASSLDFIADHRWRLVVYYRTQLKLEIEKRDAKAGGAADVSGEVRHAAKQFLQQIERVVETGDFSRQTKQAVPPLLELLSDQLDEMMHTGEEGGATEDELIERVLDHNIDVVGEPPDPLEVTLALRQVPIA